MCSSQSIKSIPCSVGEIKCMKSLANLELFKQLWLMRLSSTNPTVSPVLYKKRRVTLNGSLVYFLKIAGHARTYVTHLKCVVWFSVFKRVTHRFMLFLMRVVNITSLNKFYEQKQIHNALYQIYLKYFLFSLVARCWLYCIAYSFPYHK